MLKTGLMLSTPQSNCVLRRSLSGVPIPECRSVRFGGCNKVAKLEATGAGGDRASDHSDFFEIKVDTIHMGVGGTSIIYLRIEENPHDSSPGSLVLPLHVEVNKTNYWGIRPLTHDLAKSLLTALGVRVTQIRITEVVNSTYHARLFVVKEGSGEELDFDCRPSDAINLAVRFKAPMYLHKSIAEGPNVLNQNLSHQNLSQSFAEIAKSVRKEIVEFEDPTTVLALERDLAVHEERYEDASHIQKKLCEVAMQSEGMRKIAAMEAALDDGRYEEAAQIRDEYKKKVKPKADRMKVLGLGFGGTD